MKHKSFLILGLLALMVLAITIGGSVAQGQEPAPQSGESASAALGMAFTYQGRLTDSGMPANGAYDFRFLLWDDPTAGSQVGSTIAKDDVTVTNGLFTVRLDFGGGAFNGDARYLGIGVRPGDSTGQFTALAPRQELTPAPYALALPGLWTQQNATSPNLIGGFNGNSVTVGVVGGTVSGGGTNGWTNGVTDDYGTVSGGYNNQAGDNVGTTSDKPYATVGGGYNNNATGERSTVGGGGNNTASGYADTVGGGSGNTTSGSYAATVGGGQQNTASGSYAAVGGGDYNTASGERATIAGGNSNQASTEYATIGGGWANNISANRATIGGGGLNNASGQSATIGGGERNAASGYAATVPGGYHGVATHYGEMAYASGEFANAGDAQTSLYVLRNTSSGTTQTELFLDGISQRITITETRALAFDILVIAAADNGNAAAYHYSGGIKRDTGTDATLIGSVVELMAREDDTSWSVTIDADPTNDALRIRVTGAAGRTIRWVATVRTTETVMP